MGSSVAALRPLFEFDGNERFYRALVFSLALHALLLAIWLPQLRAARETGSSELSVILSNPAASNMQSRPMLADFRSKRTEKNLLTSTNPSNVAVQTRSTLKGPDASQTHTQELAGKPDSEAQSTTPDAVASGGESRFARKPGEARVVMEIREDGHVGQLIWGLLPALTDEQFNRLEVAIRERYQQQSQTGRFVRKTIDIRDFLGKDVIQ